MSVEVSRVVAVQIQVPVGTVVVPPSAALHRGTVADTQVAVVVVVLVGCLELHPVHQNGALAALVEGVSRISAVSAQMDRVLCPFVVDAVGTVFRRNHLPLAAA